MRASLCGKHRGPTAGCPTCQRLATAYDRRRRSAIADGTWLPRADPGPVLAHIVDLRMAGMSLNAISRACGVAAKTLQELPRRSYVHGPTAAAVLRVRPHGGSLAGNMRPAIGTARRVQALTAIGWSFAEQGRRCGMHTQQVWELAWQKSPLVAVATADRVHALFEELSATPGSSRRARNAAAKHGWLPPLAWDDLDDPGETPDVGDPVDDGVDDVVVSRALEGERLSLTVAEQAAALRLGVERGNPLSQVSNMLGINYGKARDLIGDGMPDGRLERERLEAEVLRLARTHGDLAIAGLLDVHRSTVTKVRRRIAAREKAQAA